MIDFDVTHDEMAEEVSLWAEFDDSGKAERLDDDWTIYPKVYCVMATYCGDDLFGGLNDDVLQQASHVTIVVPGFSEGPVSAEVQ